MYMYVIVCIYVYEPVAVNTINELNCISRQTFRSVSFFMTHFLLCDIIYRVCDRLGFALKPSTCNSIIILHFENYILRLTLKLQAEHTFHYTLYFRQHTS